MAEANELLDDIAVRVSGMALSGFAGVGEVEAREFGRRVADTLAEAWGGSSVYIPKNNAGRILRRNIALYNEFRGDNIAQLARKYGVTEQWVYAIIKAERHRRGTGQLTLPGLSLFS